jgi:hypothetical protein
VVAVIDQLISTLSIPKMQNLERNILGFEPESILIIISSGLTDIEKREGGLQVVYTRKELDPGL